MGQCLLVKVGGMLALGVWQGLLSDWCFLRYSLPLSPHLCWLRAYEMAKAMLCVSVSDLKGFGVWTLGFKDTTVKNGLGSDTGFASHFLSLAKSWST